MKLRLAGLLRWCVFHAVLLGLALNATAASTDVTGPVVMRLPTPTACTTSTLACNRLALDDAHTRAQVDEGKREIRILNAASYEDEVIVADVLLHARRSAVDAQPYLVHLVVSKKGDSWKHRLSPYAPDKKRRDGPFEFENWTVFLGQSDKPLLSPSLVQKALGRRSLTARAKDFFVRATDLRKQPGESPAVELGLRIGPLNFGFTRARFEPPQAVRQGGANVDLATALSKEDWYFDFQSLSSLVPAYLIRHDLFLFGLDTHPLMAQAMKAGYRGTERLRVGVKDGAGFVQLDDHVEPYAQATQTALVFLRDTYLGMLLRGQAATMTLAATKKN